MRVLVINPVKTAIWNETTLKYIQSVASPGTEVVVRSLPEGPAFIETEYDKAMAEAAVVKLALRELSASSYDAVMINCFDDPGVRALREATDTLVLGIGETSITVALTLGWRIGIVSTGVGARNAYWRRAVELGIENRVAYTGGIRIGILDLRKDEERTVRELLVEGRRAVEAGAEVIVLGCGGLVGLAERLSKELGVPVVDPTLTTFKVAEALASLRLRHGGVRIDVHTRA